MANDDYREQHERDRAAGLAARHETRVERATQRELAIVREAIEMLPATCKYHGDNLDGGSHWYGGACCDTGRPSLARRKAEEALRRLEP